MDRTHADLEEALGYEFDDESLLTTAMTHRSFANESKGDVRDNERLEYLGDAVIGLVVATELMRRFPTLPEGELSMIRAQLVSEAGLCRVAREIGLGPWLRLGKGEEQTGGRDKPSLLADAFEAVCAAVFFDSGFDEAEEFVLRHLAAAIDHSAPSKIVDPKTQLQELAQRKWREPPVYRVVGTSGPDHKKSFTVSVTLGDTEYGQASGRSKKSAEREAAKIALEKLARMPTEQ